MSGGTAPELRLLRAVANPAPVGVPLTAGRRLAAPLAPMAPASVWRRAVYPDGMVPDFQLAVKLVTGQDVNLRGPATPAGGWVATDVPRGGAGWGYAAGGTMFFSVSKNEKAATDWRNAAWVYEDIDHEEFSGKFGLMDVQRLRDAEQLTNHRIDVVNAALDEITRITHKMDNGNLAGSAATKLAAKLRELSQYITVQRDLLTEPPPTVPKVLHDAAEALAECGRALSYVWWESNQILLGAPDCEIDAVRNNINSYLSMNGLGGTYDIRALMESPQAAPGCQAFEVVGPALTPPVDTIRQVLAGYDSTVAGGLPAGMDPIAGDLTQRPVWDAVNAAITKRITVELDKLDPVARTQIAKVRTAYDAAAARLATVLQRPLERFPAVTRQLYRATDPIPPS
jgi:hypothetical protein